MRTFIKWQGNKTRFLKTIIQELPEKYNTFIEPFVGSGALFLKVEPKKWIINDANTDLINIWKTIENDYKIIIKYFKNFSKTFINLSKEDKIKKCKKLTKKLEIYSYDNAKIYLLMKFCSYMGHITKNGKFVFQGLDMKIYIQNHYYFLTNKYYNLLKDINEYLNETSGKIYNQDYKKILKKAKKNDFVFLDPPYIETEKYQLNYNKEILNDIFIDDLLKQVKKLDKKNVKWMMTQTDTKKIKDTFKNWVTELIIKNY